MAIDTNMSDAPLELVSETPEDVAILYSWANLHGAKYRDFSASRREYRAQVRHRAAEDLRHAELQAQADAEAAALEAERVAREAERAARTAESYDSSAERERALHDAEEAARRAAAERVEAARRAEAAALAEAAARREEREIAEAHASAQRQAANWSDSDIRRRVLTAPLSARMPGLASDPYEFSQGSSVDLDLPTSNRQIDYTQSYNPQRSREASGIREGVSGERRITGPAPIELRRRPQGYRPDEASGVRAAYRPAAPAPVRSRVADEASRYPYTYTAQEPVQTYEPQPSAYMQPAAYQERARREQAYPSSSYSAAGRPAQGYPEQSRREAAYPPAPVAQQRQDDASSNSPAWLYQSNPGLPASQPPADTLQQSRERVAARWFALKGVFDPAQEAAAEQATQAAAPVDTVAPLLAVFALAGGVGKTSLVATLGRTLSSMGEKVLLADTTSHGLLPYYFGASELKPGVVRTFSPPAGSTDAAIYMVSYDVDGRANDRAAQDLLANELTRSSAGTQRILVDLQASSGWVLRRLARLSPTVLVPVAPDMNSVISLHAVERYFAGATDADGRSIQPVYVINQFDAALPLHLDVREVLRRQLGDRLLPFVIRRAPAVSEALAEGMTVVDYASDAAIAEDYRNIAGWLRARSAPLTQGFRNARWSER